MAVHTVPASTSGGARGESAVRGGHLSQNYSKGHMGTVAIETQCCLKQEEPDSDVDDATQSGTAMQLVDAVRVCKPGFGLSGAYHAPFATKAPSEASTIYVP